jgi:hypothetical protein
MSGYQIHRDEGAGKAKVFFSLVIAISNWTVKYSKPSSPPGNTGEVSALPSCTLGEDIVIWSVAPLMIILEPAPRWGTNGILFEGIVNEPI